MSVKRCYDGASSTREFWKVYLLKRLLRIAPLHVLTCGAFLLFIAPGMLRTPSISWHIFTHLFFIHNWFPETYGSINGVNWSLGVEMQFYLLMAIVASTLPKLRPSIFLLLSIVVSWAWRSGVYTIFEGQTWNGVNLVWLYTSQVLGMLDVFGWGCFLALIKMQDASRVRGYGYAFLNQHWLVWAGLSCVIGTPVMKVYWKNASYWDNPAMVILWRTPAGLFWIMVLETACAMGTGQISQWAAPIRYLGTISYGIYLWHLPVISSISKTDLVHRPLEFLVVTIICTVICASTSWHLFEKPILNTYGDSARHQQHNMIFASSAACIGEKNTFAASCDGIRIRSASSESSSFLQTCS